MPVNAQDACFQLASWPLLGARPRAFCLGAALWPPRRCWLSAHGTRRPGVACTAGAFAPELELYVRREESRSLLASAAGCRGVRLRTPLFQAPAALKTSALNCAAPPALKPPLQSLSPSLGSLRLLAEGSRASGACYVVWGLKLKPQNSQTVKNPKALKP